MRPLRSPLVTALALLGLGCQQPPADDHVPPDGPPPIMGGTLLVTQDGHWAIASDPARASIHVVDLEASREVERIVLGPNDVPGRAVEGSDGTVYVVLRQAGEVASVDPRTGTVTARHEVCAAPRGIDIDSGGELLIACAEGLLVRMSPSGAIVRSVKLEPDLRDVVAQGGNVVWVSRFRSAEILVVEDDVVARRIQPRDGDPAFGNQHDSTVAWRMRRRAEGGAVMVHQHSQSSQLGTLGVPSGVYYGGSCDLGVVRTVVSTFDASGTPIDQRAFDETSLGVDVLEMGSDFLVAAASEPGQAIDEPTYRQRNGLRRAAADGGSFGIDPLCHVSDDPFGRANAATALARMPDGRIIVQYRDPGELVIGQLDGNAQTIALSGGTVDHMGHSLFHEGAGTGIACASCHPEGGDDGHVWLFDVGARRSQTLTGGIMDTLPFHWDGQVHSIDSVMTGTFVGRMAGAPPRPDEIESFETWMNALPALPGEVEDAAAVERGRAIFEGSATCTNCHSGAMRTNNASMDVNTGGRFQVPALYEVIYHQPYFHDGSAATLEDLVASGHGDTSHLADTERSDLVAYLRSL